MKKDKSRVEDVQWGDEQLREYLNFNTYDGTDRDFHCLYRAYTRMDAAAFEAFVELFKSENRNIHATNLEGKTLAQIVATHAKGGDYLAVLG
ncbi:PA4642 family protein [Reinekea marinisedimentorum]|uniref:Uncharacterized protein n=1 Tax=Reinekea marinisedimentorum TaxID=230495 RepID=A0A4R3I446_9GAMM|nr:PA4642 family protein [Reinekea marinisedimentorum]TCS40360.1 hypothetical protein BCF53_10969 [Reinekea marinisedimentorum]